ncbi:MAG TPA: hypothetical protein P5120_18565 [Spirochaetota bacterium]|nr:hypothetical protein [Spirochaetota bacterium]
MENRDYTYADVKVRAENILVSIPVTSGTKPEIPASLKEKWQKIIDVTAKCMNVPAALIMQIHEHEITVLVSSRTLDNPYSVGSSEDLTCGLYCETVLGKNSPLYIPDAMDNAHWCDNPDIKLGMISYLGFPVKWPDGEFFGTICVLDSIENPYMQAYAELMVLMQEVVERDLDQISGLKPVAAYPYPSLKDRFDFSSSGREELNDKILNAVIKGLNILSGTLSKKTETDTSDAGTDMLGITARLNNIICLMDLIYNSSDRAAIPMGICVREILESIKGNYRHECAEVSFGVDIPDFIAPDPDVAFSCGMIVTEAVINSVTHAFTGKMRGEVYIMMRETRPGEYVLHLSDNGKGVFPVKRKSGSGMAIIEELVRSLHGTVQISADNGTSYYIDFSSAGQIPVSSGRK